MITELGHFALVMALCMAIFQSVFPIAGAARNNAVWMSIARPAARVQLVFLVIAFFALAYAFITNDFSVTYVARNSNSLLPLVYRICAVWGGHEGSLLLWVLILGIWTVAVTIFSRNLPEPFVARVLGVMGLVSVGFILFMLFTSNPFDREMFPPADGADLNPLLQDPGMIIHPPMLYTGYVGFSVAFGFAIAALLGGKLDMTWARWSRPWTVLAWIFLTLGIALGSWWAYYELGWGGWWFWDPVENASFMPWLVGTALIHSLAATEKRGVFKNWTVLLAICAFSLSLLGTFLVRSGVLNSVHAFATDPARGVFILAFLAVVIGGSLTLYAWRAPGTFIKSSYSLTSRETFLLANSALLTVAMGTVLLGTLYPLVIEVFGGKVSVGAPYFNSVFVPIMALLVIVLGIGVHARWRSDKWSRLWQHLRFALLGCVTLSVLTAAMLGTDGIATVLGVLLAGWILLSTVSLIRARIRHQTSIARGIASIPRGFYGMCLAHIGLAVTIIGIAVSSNYSSDLHTGMAPGDEEVLAGYTFRLEEMRTVRGANYTATEAEIHVLRQGGKPEAVLHSQKRIYNVRDMAMTEAGIDGNLFRDLYVSLGEPLGNGRWSLRLYHKPFVRWIWLGALFMAFGGLLAVTDRRYRTVRQTAYDREPDLSAGVSVKS